MGARQGFGPTEGRQVDWLLGSYPRERRKREIRPAGLQGQDDG